MVLVVLSLLFFVCVINGENYKTLLHILSLNKKNRDGIANKKNKLLEFGYSLRKYSDVLIGPIVLGTTAYIMHAIVYWSLSKLQKKHGESNNQMNNIDESLKLQCDVDKRVLNLEERISNLEQHYSLVSTESILTEYLSREKYSNSKSAILQMSMDNMYQTNKLNSYISQSTSDLHSPCSFSVEPLRIYEIEPSSYRTLQNPAKNRVRYIDNDTWKFDSVAITNNDSNNDMKSIGSTDIHKSTDNSETLLSVTELEATDSIVLNKFSNHCKSKPDYSENQSNQNDFLEEFTASRKINSKHTQKDDHSRRKTSREKYCKTLPNKKLEYHVNSFLDSEQYKPFSQDASENKSKITVMANDNKEHDLLSSTQSGERSSDTTLIVDAICQVEIDVVSSDIEMDKICNFATDTKHVMNDSVLVDQNKRVINEIDAVNLKPDSNHSTGRGRTNQRRCISHYQQRRKERYANDNPRISCEKDSIGGKPSETQTENITGPLEKPSIETGIPDSNSQNSTNKPSKAANNNVKVVSERQNKRKNKK